MKNLANLFAITVLILSGFASQSQDVGVIAFTNMTDGQIVYPQDSINVELHVSNLGTTIVGMGDYDSLPISLYANGKLVAQHPFGGQNWMVSQTFSVVLLTMNNFETWGDHNIDSGVVNLCAKTFIWKNGVNIDIDQTNDELCLPTIILIGPPGTGGTGIETNTKSIDGIFINRGFLNISFTSAYTGNLSYIVSDMSGRIIRKNDLIISGEKSHQISLPDLQYGIYITRLISDSGDIKTYKFSVQ